LLDCSIGHRYFLLIKATFASKVEVKGENIVVTREVDGGLEKIETTLPAIVTVDLRFAYVILDSMNQDMPPSLI
jgi:electron transfer flavoprotein alpha/beta subunit